MRKQFKHSFEVNAFYIQFRSIEMPTVSQLVTFTLQLLIMNEIFYIISEDGGLNSIVHRF